MKALELTVWPHVIDGGMDCIMDREWTIRTHREIDDFAAAKRFTDAELAAEVWCAVSDAERIMGNARRGGKLHAANVASTLHRFATLPHYDEVDQ